MDVVPEAVAGGVVVIALGAAGVLVAGVGVDGVEVGAVVPGSRPDDGLAGCAVGAEDRAGRWAGGCGRVVAVGAGVVWAGGAGCVGVGVVGVVWAGGAGCVGVGVVGVVWVPCGLRDGSDP